MAQIVRLFDFKANTKIKSQEVDDELNQLVSAHNDLDTTRLKKAGDTMTGLLILSGDPAVALGAATKQYADALLDTPTFTGVVTMGGVINEDLIVSSPSIVKLVSIDAVTSTFWSSKSDFKIDGAKKLFVDLVENNTTDLLIKVTGANNLNFELANTTQIFQFSHKNSGSLKIVNLDTAASGKLLVSIITDEGDTANQEFLTRKGTPDRWEIGSATGSPPEIRFISTVVLMAGIPTADPTNTGQLWNDSGTMKISA